MPRFLSKKESKALYGKCARKFRGNLAENFSQFRSLAGRHTLVLTFRRALGKGEVQVVAGRVHDVRQAGQRCSNASSFTDTLGLPPLQQGRAGQGISTVLSPSSLTPRCRFCVAPRLQTCVRDDGTDLSKSYNMTKSFPWSEKLRKVKEKVRG